MARLVLVEANKPAPDRRSTLPEGEQAKELLVANDFPPRYVNARNGQWEFRCPFHEEPGALERNDKTNFYVDAKTSKYYCQAASCAEGGNLQTLQTYFGIDSDPVLMARFHSKELELAQFEAALTEDRREYLRKDKGLTDDTMARFKLGYDEGRDCYVIPYLEGKRPVAFRFYDPTPRNVDEEGNIIGDKPKYGGPNGSKYWWESAEKSISNFHTADEGTVLRLFNPGSANGDASGRVILCEGELKAMLLCQHGYSAVSLPGASSWKPEWAQFFMHAREVIVLMDNDNPQAHMRANCRKCGTVAEADCDGHNPGQEAAAKLVDFFGKRAKNVVLPLPDGERKTDINEYMMRDGHSFQDFERLAFGSTVLEAYVVRTLSDIRKTPPPETLFLIGNGFLSKGGRLLVTGAPKVGKSIFIENMVLSIAAGIPFLGRFPMANDGVDPGHRVLLLDRELSERSLFDRFGQLIDERPGYAAAEDKLLIDHRFKLQLDAPNAANNLRNLVNANGIEVIVLDTAYKFFSGDMESMTSVKKALASIDEVITDTGVSVILTHHHRKGSNNPKEAPSADSVVGSFIWTGWPNGTVLLNFKNRSVADPYTTIASFVAWRDAAAPEPLLLRRDKTSITYKEITDFSFDEDDQVTAGAQWSGNGNGPRPKLTPQALADLLMKRVPVHEDEFRHVAAGHFGTQEETVRRMMLTFTQDYEFVKDKKVWAYKFDKVEESYQPAPDGPLAGQTTIEDMLA